MVDGGGPDGGADTIDTADGELPEETAGPYPGDGSNGAKVLTDSGVVRSDITSSFGSSNTRAEGIPLTVTMSSNDFSADKNALAGGAVYRWHCNRDGAYSLYSRGIENENYLRGVQETDVKGQVTFTTIFPACYPGRWPHIHFEVYPSLAKATNSATRSPPRRWRCRQKPPTRRCVLAVVAGCIPGAVITPSSAARTPRRPRCRRP